MSAAVKTSIHISNWGTYFKKATEILSFLIQLIS